MPAGPLRPRTSQWWKSYRAIVTIGKSMVTRSTSAHKRIGEFLPLRTMGPQGNRMDRLYSTFRRTLRRTADLFKVLG